MSRSRRWRLKPAKNHGSGYSKTAMSLIIFTARVEWLPRSDVSDMACGTGNLNLAPYCQSG